MFAGLEDHAIAAGKRGGQRIGQDRDGRIPRGDAGDDPIGNADRQIERVLLVERHDVAVQLVGPAGIVAKDARGIAHLTVGFADHLAVVGSLQHGHALGLGVEQIGGLVEQSGAFARRGLAPDPVKGAARCRYGLLDIARAGERDLAVDLLIIGIDRGHGLARGARAPFAIDMELVGFHHGLFRNRQGSVNG